MKKHLRNMVSFLAFVGAAGSAMGQSMSSAFTYQGELQDGASVGDGAYDIRFRLFDDGAAGAQIGPTLCANNVSVFDGRFAVSVDFGASAFSNRPMFLEIEVRKDAGLGCESAAGFTVLGPRQALTPAPFARLSADSVLFDGQPPSFYLNAGNFSAGVLADARLSPNVPRFNAAGTFSGNMTFAGTAQFQTASFTAATGTFSGNGSGLTSLNATNISAGTLADARLSSNIPRLNAAGTFTGNMSFSGSTQFQTASFVSATGTFSGNGAGLTTLNAANISSGTLADARLSSNIARLNATLSLFSGDVRVLGEVTTQTLTYDAPQVRHMFISPGELNGALAASFGDPPKATNNSIASTLSSGASIHLPDGAVVTELRVYMVDNATADMQFLVLRRPLDGSAGGTMALIDTAGVSTSSAVRLMSDVSISGGTIDNLNNQYFLRVQIEPTSVGVLEFRGAVVTYTVNTPLP